MNNEISDHVKLLAEKAKKLNGDVLAVEGTINEPLGAFVDDYLFYSKDIQDYIASLETELAALKAEVAKYEWQSGHPEDDRDVWVCWNDGLGGKMYESGWYDKNWFDENSMPCNDDAVHAWSEIRPYGGE